jgi:hypothetical protein
MTPPKFGIIGARRRSQGIGEYVARDLAALGADVCAIAGTTQKTVAEAVESLRKRFGIAVRGYTSAKEMMRAEPLDAVAICSPQSFHREHLRLALDNELHVLCEKPFVFEAGRDNLADTAEITTNFANAGLVLMVNQQWPYTLPAFRRCFPNLSSDDATFDRLEMLLAPAEQGIEMIPNALPHVLSSLLEIASPGGQAAAIEIEPRSPSDLRISFRYLHDNGEVAVAARFVQGPSQPRPAGYAINGCTALRRIDLATYQMYFEPIESSLSDLNLDSGPSVAVESPPDGLVPVEDPLRLLLADFISRIENPASWSQADARILDNVRILDDVYLAARSSLDG